MIAKGKVLIVDDEPDTISLIKTLLINEGYEVIDALKGEEGLIKASQENPDMVLIDLRLPDMDGNKLLKRIKENNPTQSVIMITAYADVDNAITSLKFGADDFIKKPFDNAHLIHLVNKSLEKKEVIKEKKNLEKKYEQLVGRKPMSKKENLVLYILTRHPGLSDKELSEKIGIPRTTLTGIKNKLKRKGVYKNLNIPNYPTLGFELMSVITFDLNSSISHHKTVEDDLEILKKKDVIYALITDLEGFLICIFKDYTDYKKNMEPHLHELIHREYFKNIYIHHFSLRLSRIIRFMDFSPIIHRLLEIEGEVGIREGFMRYVKERKTSQTEGRLINALTTYPEHSDAEVAGKVLLSRARVSQIKKKLTVEGVIQNRGFPDLSNLGAKLITVISAGMDPKCTREERTSLINHMKSESSTVLFILGDTEFLSINILKDYDYYKEVYDGIANAGKVNNCIISEMKTTLLPMENIRATKIDFASTLKKLSPMD